MIPDPNYQRKMVRSKSKYIMSNKININIRTKKLRNNGKKIKSIIDYHNSKEYSQNKAYIAFF